MTADTTLLELVTFLSDRERDDAEVVRAVVALVNGGHVRLTGNFRGTRFAAEDALG